MNVQDLVPAAGVEPATFRSGGERSNPLSYAGTGDIENIAQRQMRRLGDRKHTADGRRQIQLTSDL